LIVDFKRRRAASKLRKNMPSNAQLVFLKYSRRGISTQQQYLKAFIKFAEKTGLKNENWKPLNLYHST